MTTVPPIDYSSQEAALLDLVAAQECFAAIEAAYEEANAVRNQRLCDARRAGCRLAEMARRTGLSAPRVQQLAQRGSAR